MDEQHMSVMLPTPLAQRVSQRDRSPTAAEAPIRTARNALAVLVVTRDAEVARVADLLRSQGTPAEVAASYAEANDIVQRVPRCIAVLDYAMPEGELVPTYQLLHAAEQTPLLALLDPDGDRDTVFDAHGAATDFYAYKPCPSEELVHRVMALVVRAGY